MVPTSAGPTHRTRDEIDIRSEGKGGEKTAQRVETLIDGDLPSSPTPIDGARHLSAAAQTGNPECAAAAPSIS